MIKYTRRSVNEIVNMNTFQTTVIIHGQPTQRKEYIDSYIRSNTICPEDIATIQILENDIAIKIDQVRLFQKQIAIRPVRSSYKIGIIYELHQASEYVQNALLKTLEEPPSFTKLFITAPSANSLLPTISSRCFIHAIPPSNEPKLETSDGNLIQNQLNASPGEKLVLAEQLASDKENALNWISRTILFFRYQLVELTTTSTKQKQELFAYINKLMRAYVTLVNTSVNTRLFIENLLLELSLPTQNTSEVNQERVEAKT